MLRGSVAGVRKKGRDNQEEERGERGLGQYGPGRG